MKLQQARESALALPQAEESPHFDHTSFRVRGRIFATAPPEGTHLHVFVDEDLRAPLAGAAPDVYEPLTWGARVVGLRIRLSRAAPAVVQRLLHAAWARKAGPRLAAAGAASDAAPGRPRPARPAPATVDATAPVTPGYSGKPLSGKLGWNAAQTLCALQAPPDYALWLQPWPQGATVTTSEPEAADLVHLFCTRRADLARELARLRRCLGPEVPLWVSWPKKSARMDADITEQDIRDLALPLGWVDVKVCAVSPVWSGLKLVVRKALRPARSRSSPPAAGPA